MSSKACSYHKCRGNRYKVRGLPVLPLRLFRFPKEAYLCRIWVINSGNSDLIGLSPETLYMSKRICEKHFKKSDFLPSKRLMRGSAPIPYVFEQEESGADSLKGNNEDTKSTKSETSDPKLNDVDDNEKHTRGNSLAVQEKQENEDNPTTSQSLKRNDVEVEPNNSKATESVEHDDESINNLTDLKSIVKKLDALSEKLAPTILGDSFDQFGRYISSLLRNLPPKKVLCIKKKLVSDVLDALLDEERGTYRGTLGQKSVATQVPDQLSNKQILGGKVPVLLPPQGMSTNPFKLLSVINVPPKTVYPNPQQLPFVTKSVVEDPLSSSQTTTCDSVRTISSSSEGTLIEVKLPNRLSCALRDSLDNKPKKTPPKSQRKRKLTPNVYQGKRPQPSTSSLLANTLSAADRSSGKHTVSQASTSSLLSNTVSATDGRLNVDSEYLASISSLLANTDSAVDGIFKIDTENIGEEFKIDIEEGRELKNIKEDPSAFETVLCTDTNTYVEVKEEAPDEEDALNCGEDDTSGSDQLLICDMCSASCVSKTDMIRHFTTSHSGCVPTLKLNPKHDTESTVVNEPMPATWEVDS